MSVSVTLPGMSFVLENFRTNYNQIPFLDLSKVDSVIIEGMPKQATTSTSANQPQPSTSSHEQSNKNHLAQKFTTKWLDDPKLKGWIRPVENSQYKAKCSACDIVLGTKKSDLLKHGQSKKHCGRVESISNMKSLDRIFEKSSDESVKRQNIIADLRYALLIVGHNLSFSVVDHIIEISKLVFANCSSSAIGTSLKHKRTKCTYIMKNILSPEIALALTEKLLHRDFSILVDESTDIGNCKLLCILVRYIDNNLPQTDLLDIIRVGADEGSAKGLYSLFKKSMAKFNINLTKIVGYCSDNASVMMGNNQSFKTYLLQDNPDVISIGCTCHSAHLIANAAVENIPSNVEQLLHYLHSYFSKSPKRQSVLEEFQRYFSAQKLKILNTSKTRWLSLSNCVERVLNQWEILIHLFRLAAFEEKTTIATIINNELQNPFVKAYLLFLKYILPEFNQFNRLFQSENVLIHTMTAECMRFIRSLCFNFVRKEFLINDETILKINVCNPDMLLPLDDVVVGLFTISELEKAGCGKKDIEQFKLNCLKFYQKAVNECFSRFKLNDPFLSNLDFLFPQNCLDIQPVNLKGFGRIVDRFKQKVDSDKALAEFMKLKSYFSEREKNILIEKSTIEFWCEIKSAKNYNGELLFENVSKLALHILTLPHGNADVERVFSMVSDIKTKKRNRLSTEMLSCLVRIKLDMHKKGYCCTTYPITENHITKFKSDTLYA